MRPEDIERISELDQRVLRFKTAEGVLRELKKDYKSLESVINPSIAIIVANREKMEKEITELEMGNR